MIFKKLKLMSAMIVSSIILMACSNPFDQLADEINSFVGDLTSPTEETGSEEEPTAEEEAEALYERIDYSHLYGEGTETTIGMGEHAVGEDVMPGRYRVTTTADHSAYLAIYDDEEYYVGGEVIVSENTDDSLSDYPTEVLVYVDEGHNIEVTSDYEFVFTPVETSYEEELPPGTFVVGEDIEAGDYRVSTENQDMGGRLSVYQVEAFTSARHSVGEEEYGGKETFVTTFDEGDIVELSGIASVQLEKIE